MKTTESLVSCRNCGAALQGEYCSVCGQREGRADLRLRDVLGEFADDFVQPDSRMWRTLSGLVLRPGFLTAEFIAGRRARYLPPLRLYLTLSFILFLVVSCGFSSIKMSIDPESVDMAEGGKNGSVEVTIPVKPADSSLGVDAGSTSAESEDASGLEQKLNIELADADSPQWLKDLERRVEDNAADMAADPARFVDALMDYLPQMMFLLLPVFALLVRLCYLFSDFHYLQHLVFALHYHSFIYLIYLLAGLVEWLGRIRSDGWMLFFCLTYLILALRKAYNSGFAAALGKGLVILGVDAILLLFAFALMVVAVLAFA